MNKAITKGFEKDVGNRTTHHFLYPESAVDVAPGVSLVLLPFKLRDLEWLTSALSTGTVKMYDHDHNHDHDTRGADACSRSNMRSIANVACVSFQDVHEGERASRG